MAIGWRIPPSGFPAKSSLIHKGQGVFQASIQLVTASLQNGFLDTRRIMASRLTFSWQVMKCKSKSTDQWSHLCRGEDIYIKQPTFRLVPISLIPSLMRLSGPTITYASMSHSYQTFLSSVCLQMLTSNSESSGK